MRDCVTHHYACECREERFRKLLEAANKVRPHFTDYQQHRQEFIELEKAIEGAKS